MDGRPISATIVPFLALAGVLVAGGAVVALQTQSGRTDLVRRSRDWALAMTRHEVDEAERFVDPRSLRDPAGERGWRMLAAQLDGRPMRLRHVRVDGPRAESTFLVPVVSGRGPFHDEQMLVQERIVKWGRGADGLWYVEP